MWSPGPFSGAFEGGSARMVKGLVQAGIRLLYDQETTGQMRENHQLLFTE